MSADEQTLGEEIIRWIEATCRVSEGALIGHGERTLCATGVDPGPAGQSFAFGEVPAGRCNLFEVAALTKRI
jgi:hypothetical protein